MQSRRPTRSRGHHSHGGSQENGRVTRNLIMSVSIAMACCHAPLTQPSGAPSVRRHAVYIERSMADAKGLSPEEAKAILVTRSRL